ncbi:hypothetical protein PWT90_10399 [Aphanocladium album]|nr:hypothetical protein PWT90_10399 [Aphanocladium album]
MRDPDRRYHPFFFPCGTKPAASKFDIMPLRRKAKSRSQSPPKRSATTSGAASPNKPDDDAAADGNMCNDMVAPAALNIDTDAAKKKEGEFRMACLAQAARCAVSGEGALLHLPDRDGGGRGGGDNADAAAMRHRVRAWYETWSSHNGILLMRHLHLLFDCRLFAIHPVTLRIRAFVPYQAVTRYHGQKAQVPSIVDRKALRHHYDLCCIENMAALRPMQELPPSATTSGRCSPAASAIMPGAGGTMPMSGLTSPSLPMTPPTQAMASLPSGDPSKRPRPDNSDHDGGTDYNNDGNDNDTGGDDGGDLDYNNNYHDSDSYDDGSKGTDSQELLCGSPSCGYCQNCLECITRITRAVGNLERKTDWCQDCQECECSGLGGCEWCDLCGCRINDQ